MSNHTPGPWRLYSGSDDKRWIVQRGASGGFIVEAHDPESALCDARLIAAAPDLLDALKYAGELLEHGDFDMAKIDAAIEKAEGTP